MTHHFQRRGAENAKVAQRAQTLRYLGAPGVSALKTFLHRKVVRVQKRKVDPQLAALEVELADQKRQLEQLRSALQEQKQLLQRAIQSFQSLQASDTKNLGWRPDADSIIQVGSGDAADNTGATPLSVDSTVGVLQPPSAASQEIIQPATTPDLAKKIDDLSRNLGGFKFSGDFRFRFDAQLRSGNAVAGPVQNVRSRYRLRLNMDREWDPTFKFHLQLSTGAFNNGLTSDQDFAGTIARHPFSIAEAYIDFHPTPKVALRGGRMEEVFMDNMKFLWDDSARFNGFHQILTLPVKSHALGFKAVEFRAGEYFLTNPNIVILSPSSPLVLADFKPGQKVRDAMLFHPGLVVHGDLSEHWSHHFTGDVQIYRNPNQIQLASLPAGFPVLVSNALGIALSGPMAGVGNATTTPDGAIYSAPNFQIARIAYRLENSAWKFGKREMPLWLDFQAARNIGTSKLRDAVMASVNVGSVKRAGDVRFLYQFAIKDANSLISQLTDDDLGTLSGVNIAAHGIRFDLGLARFIRWDNSFFIQNQRRPNNPAEQFFVPLQRGAGTTYRYIAFLGFIF